MLLIDNFRQVTAQIENERGIAPEVLISAIEQALVTACKKKLSEDLLLEATIDTNTGEAKIFQIKVVVNEVEDSDLQISLKDARKKDPTSKIDSEIKYDVTPSDFGRIAALTAKQVIIQRIREAEKSSIYEEFEDKETEDAIGTKVISPMKNDTFSHRGRDQLYFSSGVSGLIDCFERPDDVLEEIEALGDSMSPVPGLYKNKKMTSIGHSGASFPSGVNSFKRTGSKRGYFSSPPRVKKQKKERSEDEPIDNLEDLAKKLSLSSGNFSTRKDIFN